MTARSSRPSTWARMSTACHRRDGRTLPAAAARGGGLGEIDAGVIRDRGVPRIAQRADDVAARCAADLGSRITSRNRRSKRELRCSVTLRRVREMSIRCLTSRRTPEQIASVDETTNMALPCSRCATPEGGAEMKRDDLELVRGSGNVYRDFGRPDAGPSRLWAVTAAKIIRLIIDERKLSTRDAEKLTGVSYSEFSSHRQYPARPFHARSNDRDVGARRGYRAYPSPSGRANGERCRARAISSKAPRGIGGRRAIRRARKASIAGAARRRRGRRENRSRSATPGAPSPV